MNHVRSSTAQATDWQVGSGPLGFTFLHEFAIDRCVAAAALARSPATGRPANVRNRPIF
jgi:hypothetical protein